MRRYGTVLGCVLALGCRKEPEKQAAPGSAGGAPIAIADAAPPGSVDAASTVVASGDAGSARGGGGSDVAAPGDAGPADAAIVDAGLTREALAKAEWPLAIESTMVEVQNKVGEYELDLAYPRFRTRPPAIAKELEARFAPLVDPGVDLKAHQGQLYVRCTRTVVNRLVVIADCERMRDARTLEEWRNGTGGAPAGPDPIAIAVWLQPGLPAIRVDELAPGVDVAAVLAKVPASCRSQCTFAADHFVIDDDGSIRFVPTSFCEPDCGVAQAPRIPLDTIRPTHPWAKKLGAWIRQRLDAGESLVK